MVPVAAGRPRLACTRPACQTLGGHPGEHRPGVAAPPQSPFPPRRNLL